MSAPIPIKLAMQRWLDEVDPQIREHVGEAAAEPVDPREVDRAIAWVRDFTDDYTIDFDRWVARIANMLELPLDSSSVWPEHLREALGW